MARKRTLQEIDREIAKLNQEADAIRASEKAEVAAKMKDAIAYYGFTAADLGLARGGKKEAKASTKASTKVATDRIREVSATIEDMNRIAAVRSAGTVTNCQASRASQRHRTLVNVWSSTRLSSH